MKRTTVAGLLISLSAGIFPACLLAQNQSAAIPPSPTYVFSLVGSDLETRNPVAIIGTARVISANQVSGSATLNDGGHICKAVIGGKAQPGPDGTIDTYLTLSTTESRCPSPLEFHGVISSSGKILAAIEVDSKLVTAGVAWQQ